MKTKKETDDEIKQFGLIFMPINWLICAVVTTILWLSINSKWGLGYLLGSLTSFLTFGLHMKNSRDYGSQKANAYMKSVTGFGVRFVLSGVILAVAYFLDDFDLIATFIGLVVIKFVLIIFTIIRQVIINKKEENKKKLEEENKTDETLKGGDEVSI